MRFSTSVAEAAVSGQTPISEICSYARSALHPRIYSFFRIFVGVPGALETYAMQPKSQHEKNQGFLCLFLWQVKIFWILEIKHVFHGLGDAAYEVSIVNTSRPRSFVHLCRPAAVKIRRVLYLLGRGICLIFHHSGTVHDSLDDCQLERDPAD